MSQGKRWPREVALAHAREIVAKLAPHCELEVLNHGERRKQEERPKIEIAGSLRRGRPDVGDIEIVAMPWQQKNLFGERRPMVGFNDTITGFLLENNVGLEVAGPKLKRFKYAGIQVDLFLVEDIDRWGWRYLLSTGSGDFNKWMVTPRDQGGIKPPEIDNFHGWLHYQPPGQWKTRAQTPTERSVFELYGLPWIPPEDRDDQRWLKYV